MRRLSQSSAQGCSKIGQSDFDMQGITIWYVLLDTSSSVSDLAPYGPNSPSFRLTKELSLLPSWTYLGFNQMVDVDLSKGIKKPADVLRVNYQKAYGRPVSSDTCTFPFFFLLYFTLQYWSGLSNFEVLEAAREKLFLNHEFDPKKETHVFAALAVRVGLEIGEGEASSRLAVETVSSHMRILTGVVGPLIVTTSPSGPILAIAAAMVLNTSSETYQDVIETLLDKLILRGLIIDHGLQGELYSRLLLS